MLPSSFSFSLMSTLMLITMAAFASPGGAAEQPPATHILDGEALMAQRERVRLGDPEMEQGIAELRRRAARQMTGELWSVVNKPFAGPSGDKHDYVSLASYFWPDPDSPTSLPYVSRDGVVNPETYEYDRRRLERMCDLVHTLALAHYLLGEPSYGERAAAQLRVWFLDEATRMNPHLTNAQMIRGKNEGSSFGLIETEALTRVVDAVGLLRATGAWPQEDDRKLRQWFAQYLDWLLTSKLGQGESRSPGNHGTLYDVQTTVFALYTGQEDLARQILEKVGPRRIATQIEPDGAQPQELRRTRSLSYAQLNLTGMMMLAFLGEKMGVDLWNYRSDDGRSIRGALDWMMPYVHGKPWERQQITPHNLRSMVWILRMAAPAYCEPAYEEAIGRLAGVEGELLWVNLLYPAKASPPPR